MSAELVGYHKANGNENSIDGQDNPAFQEDVKITDVDNNSPHKAGTTNGAAIEMDNVSGKEDKDGKKEEEKKEEEKMVGFFEIFRFADKLDVLLMMLGTLGGIANGAGMPLMMIVFGQMTDSFINDGKYQFILQSLNLTEMKDNFTKNPSSLQPYLDASIFNETATELVPADLFETMKTFAIYYCIIGCGILVAAYFQVAFWMSAAERQTRKIRLHFFKSILRQDVGWFDVHETGQLNTRLSDDITKIHDGIGDKLGGFFQGLAGTITGFIIGFVYGWQLTLVILAASPALILATMVMAKLTSTVTTIELAAYAKAGGVAEEVLTAIRTVVAFGGQTKECERYNGHLEGAKKGGIKKGLISGVGLGLVFVVMFACYALGFWYGGTLVQEQPKNYSAGVMMIVFFSILIGAFSLGQAAPNFANLATARGAAYHVFNVIYRVPPIDIEDEGGEQPSSVTGNIELRGVNFWYPSRPDVQIMKDFNLTVGRGQTVALVGPSGCGKSTTVQLLQRFYDPRDGEVFLDGKNIKDLNIKWLRSHIGIVSQEPTLFATTIAENIRYGREGVTQQEIEQACREANAYDFIDLLPEKYETLVGERGAQLSGGQKQRIAIARALVRDPRVLLLDEATSALDTESEATVQAALDKARQGRTTIVIAHRLSTIKTADVIAGISDGRVAEKGTHDELMAQEGLYYQLVTSQSQKKDEDDESDDEEEVKLDRTLSARSSQKGKGLNRMLSATSMGSNTDKAKVETEEEKIPEVSATRVMKMNASEWPYIVLGCFGALVNGAVMPVFAIIFSEILGVFAETDKKKQMADISMYSLLFLAIGLANGLAILVQNSMFAISGENLTMRLRQMAFKAILRQNVEYFDDPANNTGALTTRLATEASAVQGATGTRIGTMVQSMSNLGVALVIAFVYSWRLTLVILAFIPFIAIGGFIEMKLFSGQAATDKSSLEEAGKTAVEAISNIRTVASLVKENMFYRLFLNQLEHPYKSSLKKAHLVGFTFGFSQCVIFFAYAAAFTYGAYLVQISELDPNDDLDVNFVDVIKVFSSIIFGAMALGQASSFAPDYGKAKTAANNIFYLLDQEPSIDAYSEEGEKPATTRGSLEFKDIYFNYPSRPGVPILRGLNVSVEPGQTLALVGSSGCGKSTTVALTERLYDPLQGHVMLDGHNILNLNLQWLRSQIGIVSQEPVLFDRSIRDNIAYGDNSREVMMDEIISAARSANIHSFIEGLPNGYDTSAGDKGTQLSGGQKQRIAIARALVRNPKILLLDEATSALDTESERIVQEALDNAREGRTSLVIAHRLSTIQNADKIAVIHRGKVAELGTHNQLLANQGLYYKLNNAQLFQK